MDGTLRKTMGLSLAAVVAALVVAPSAWSDDDNRHRWRGERHEKAREHRREADKKAWEHRREAEKKAWGHGREVDKKAWEHRREAAERHRDWRRVAERREWERRRDLERHRAAALWRFERGHGWRFEHRPGAWSPAFVWWVIDGRPHLRPYPTARIVRYPTGYYELIGDGFTVPYYWVWRPTVVVATPPPVPLPPPPPAEYPFPADGMYPPPPGG